jgi:hypothetical protein
MMGQVVEYLPSKCKALISNSSSTNKEGRKRKKKKDDDDYNNNLGETLEFLT